MTPAPKRRLFRWSLRTLFVVVFVTAIVFATWPYSSMPRASYERRFWMTLAATCAVIGILGIARDLGGFMVQGFRRKL